EETRIDLVAIGSPHVSLTELRELADAFEGHHVHPDVDVIVTVGRDVLEDSRKAGDTARLEEAGVKIYPDICWCSITEPVFPKTARTLMTNSGKYAHYATGLTGRHARFGTVSDCVRAALTGRVSSHMPEWLR
ncbi:MAG: aconitase X, partial [Paracoccaceae bacterium]|nr:aconitase X [Paracoccaceae bacterium]